MSDNQDSIFNEDAIKETLQKMSPKSYQDVDMLKSSPAESRGPLSFGEKAVGISFNPSKDIDVEIAKQRFAQIIDGMDQLRKDTQSAEIKRLCSIAITESQTAQMWAVKAITWKD